MTNPYIKKSTHPEITKLILGENKNEHVITCKDRFLDNGLCIQLIKEIPMKVRFQGDSLVLKVDDIKGLERFSQTTHKSHEYSGFHVFSLEYKAD
jgi:hypothetical protein